MQQEEAGGGVNVGAGVNLGAGVFIQRAGANSSKVCVGAGVYGKGAGVYRQNQKYGIAQVLV